MANGAVPECAGHLEDSLRPERSQAYPRGGTRRRLRAIAQRGVYVSFDGGATFSKTLYLSEQSGASDMAMDPKNPNVIYAGMWHVLRRPWALTSGGANDDGLYRSSDGGRTWSQVSGNGFPAAPIGRIGIAIAPSQPSRIYALVESTAGVLWRSDDSGVTWKMVSTDSMADQRPFYFSHVRVSPTDANTVYGVSFLLATSYNAGEKFNLAAFSVHPDLHDMWISSDGSRMALAGDGGIAISANGGATWANSRNIAIGQVYRVGLSNTIPTSSAAACRIIMRTAARHSTATSTGSPIATGSK